MIINFNNYKNMMSHDENHDEGEGWEGHKHCHQMGGPMRKEFKLAMLEKKEKILKAELEFIGRMKELLAKLPEVKE
jgi:hypothetical protein